MWLPFFFVWFAVILNLNGLFIFIILVLNYLFSFSVSTTNYNDNRNKECHFLLLCCPSFFSVSTSYSMAQITFYFFFFFGGLVPTKILCTRRAYKNVLHEVFLNIFSILCYSKKWCITLKKFLFISFFFLLLLF